VLDSIRKKKSKSVVFDFFLLFGFEKRASFDALFFFLPSCGEGGIEADGRGTAVIASAEFFV